MIFLVHALCQSNTANQNYSRLRCLLLVKGLVICFYLGWSGSILQIRTNIIKVGSKSWLFTCSIWAYLHILHTVAIWTLTFHKKQAVCVVNLWGQFQMSLEAKTIIFFIWKFRSIILIFLLFFSRNCQIQSFLDTVDAISKRLKYLSHIFASNCNLNRYFDLFHLYSR